VAHRVGADGGHVEAQVLPRLGPFHQHAAAAGRGAGDVIQHRVGALQRLDPQDLPARGHRPLPHVERPQRVQNRARAGHVRLRQRIARSGIPASATRSGRRAWAPTTANAAFLEDRRDVPQERVVALGHRRHQAGHQRLGHLVERRGVERRARHGAGETDLGDAHVCERVESAPRRSNRAAIRPAPLSRTSTPAKATTWAGARSRSKPGSAPFARDDRPRAHAAQPGVR
jgi:hypothetical protein